MVSLWHSELQVLSCCRVSGGDKVTHLWSLEFCALLCPLLSAPFQKLLSKNVLSLETATLCTHVLPEHAGSQIQVFSTHGLSREGTTGKGSVNGH